MHPPLHPLQPSSCLVTPYPSCLLQPLPSMYSHPLNPSSFPVTHRHPSHPYPPLHPFCLLPLPLQPSSSFFPLLFTFLHLILHFCIILFFILHVLFLFLFYIFLCHVLVFFNLFLLCIIIL